MAVVNEFNGKLYIEPTVAVQIVNGIPVPTTSTYGTIQLIDTGLGNGYAGGKASIPVTNTYAKFIGDADLSSGHDWSSVNQTFTVNLNGGGATTVTLNANCTNLVQVIAHINAALVTAGILKVYCYDAGTNFVAISSIVANSSQTLILGTGSPDALATLGITAGTETGTSTSGNGRQIHDMLYEFNTESSLKTFLTGGILWDLAFHLYHPFQGQTGANKVNYLKASESSPSSTSFTFASGKRITLKTIEEGTATVGDNTTVLGKLTKGYAIKLICGTVDITKFKFQFYKGTYKGVDSNGYLYENKSITDAANSPLLLFESNEFTNFSDFITWSLTNESFATYFTVDTTNSDASGVVATADLTTYSGYNCFDGGQDSYTTDALTNILSEITTLDYSFILSLEYGNNAWNTNNIAILNYILNQRERGKVSLHIGGQDNKDNRGTSSSTDSTTSCGAAIKFNSSYVTIYHGGDYKLDVTKPTILKPISSIYKAAKCVGLRAGLQPMDSLTYKQIESFKPQDVINNKEEREALIQLGVNITFDVPSIGHVICLDINSLQSPANLVYQTTDGSNNAISYENVSMQIKQELTNLTIDYFTPRVIGQRNNQIDTSILLNIYNSFMADRKADGLITNFRNLSIVRQGTAYFFYGEYTEPTTIEQIFIKYSATI